MDKAKTNIQVKIKHLYDAYLLVQAFAYSSNEVEIKSGLETLKSYLTNVFPVGGQSPEYPIARKVAEFTIWRIEQVLKNKIELTHVNHALVQDMRLIAVLFETHKGSVRNEPLPIHKAVSKF